MKKGLLIWNAALTLLVGYLLYSNYCGKSCASGTSTGSACNMTHKGNFSMAYFEMDSIAANFDLVKDLKKEMEKRETSINQEMDKMAQNMQQRYNGYQAQANAGKLNQAQSDAAGQELKQMDDQMKARKQALDAEYSDYVMRRQNEIKLKIEEFLKEYNKMHNYSYIVSYEQGLFYYKDPAYNITNDVIKGLNEAAKKEKK
jgi:outer membrane protein